MNSFRDEGRQGTVVRSRPQFLPEFHSNAEFSQGKLYEPSPLTYDININYMSMINIDIDWSIPRNIPRSDSIGDRRCI